MSCEVQANLKNFTKKVRYQTFLHYAERYDPCQFRTSMRTTKIWAKLNTFLAIPEAELGRLQLQAKWLGSATLRLLHATGLAAGMSVLDIGTGAGDVALLAADLVGPKGQVLGIDRDEGALDLARGRARDRGLSQVRFEAAPFEIEDDAKEVGDTFDLVIGRMVLQHQPDAVAFIRTAAKRVKLGGRLAFCELGVNFDEQWSDPSVPRYEDVKCWIFRTLAAFGALPMGSRLIDLFVEAGLSEPSVLGEIPLGGPSSSIIEWCVSTLGSLMPHVERYNVASAAEVGLDTLAERIRTSATQVNAQLRGPAGYGAWTQID